MKVPLRRALTDAVSEVMGTVLLLGITVMLFGTLSVGVYRQLDRAPAPPNTDFRIDLAEQRTTITPTWGEALETRTIRLVFDVNGSRTFVALDSAPLASNLAHRSQGSSLKWDIGEPLRMGCPAAEACAYPGSSVRNVTVIHDEARSVIYSSEPGVGQGSFLRNLADLSLSLQGFVDPLRQPSEPYYNGGTFILTANVSNRGVLATPSGDTIRVQYFLDFSQTAFYTYDHTSGLAVGAAFSTSNPGVALTTGSHAVRVRVDGLPTVPEAGYGNNEFVHPYAAVAGAYDPGSPYEDGNSDSLYNPYVTNDLLVAAAQVTDGVYTATGSKGLVIPPSTGTIASSTVNVDFRAGGTLTIGVNVTSTNNKRLTLDAGGDIVFPSAVEILSGEEMTVDADDDISMAGVTFDTNNRAMTVTAGNTLTAGSARFYKSGFGSNPSTIDITAGEAIDMTATLLVAAKDISVDAAGNLAIPGADIDSGDNIDLDVSNPGNTVSVAGAVIQDDDDCADVDPSGALVSGSPSSGVVQVQC